jgi:hypothetical protein
VSQQQAETSSGLGLKIGAVIIVLLIAVVYFARSGDEPLPVEPQSLEQPADTGLSETRPNSAFQGQPIPGRAVAPAEQAPEEVDTAAKLRATPMQRPLGQAPKVAGQARGEMAAGSEPAEIDDDSLEDIPTLKQMALYDPDPERRLTAVTLLGVSENKEAITILAQALSDQDEDVRMEAVLALADFSDEAPVEALEIALSDPSADVRYEALDVLSDIETPEAYRAMKRALDDPDEDVRELAEILIELYDDEEYAQ